MDFTESIKQFSERVSMLKDTVSTEEATKMSLVVPLFQLLGYDVFNPSEFCPEYIADVGIKKGEKVDYAILENGQPIILVECKSCSEQLDKHSSQLFRYFGTSPAKFGILTNGVIYRFYTDLEESNKMDLVPFLELPAMLTGSNPGAFTSRVYSAYGCSSFVTSRLYSTGGASSSMVSLCPELSVVSSSSVFSGIPV